MFFGGWTGWITEGFLKAAEARMGAASLSELSPETGCFPISIL